MIINTPWGKADSCVELAEGIHLISTASHGGYHLSRKRLNRMPQYFRKECADGAFFEEDCCWCVVPLSFPEAFSPSAYDSAKTTLLNWFPDLYEYHFSVKVTPAMSQRRREQVFERESFDKFVPRSAWGDWEETTPKGFVTVLAVRKSDNAERYFLVPDDAYKGLYTICDGYPSPKTPPTGRSKK